MTPAELKTTRESLGLSVAWLAERAGVQERTVRYWESGHMPVPADVAQLIEAVDSSIENGVSLFRKGFAAAREAAGRLPADRDKILLIRYRTDEELWAFRPDMRGLPATCHAALISRVRRALWAEGIPSTIQFMDPRAYHDWLAGREDTESMRSAWAGSLPE